MQPAIELNQDLSCVGVPPAFPSEALVHLQLDVVDPEVAIELRKHAEGSSREKFALGALRVGVLALRQAAGELDATAVREAGRDLIGNLADLLSKRGTELTTELSSALRQYFDPQSGALPQRIESLLRHDGELDRALREHLAPENSTIAAALAAHLGEGSDLFKLLSPTDANGVKAQIAGLLESVLAEQQEQILREFSLDNDQSALSRLIRELSTNNGELKTNLEGQVAGLVGEFSLDKPDSALSRLVGKVEAAQKAIAEQFSTDNEQSAITRLSRMLDDTRQQIDRNLTLDDDNSALSRLRREIQTAIDGLVKCNTDFQGEVRTTLAAMQIRREEAAKSTLHGHDFEGQLGIVLAAEAQRFNDLHEATGSTTGAIKNCKMGDFVTELGPDSAAPGARIVWEAKDDKSYDLKRALAEVEEARKNRQAQVGVFVFGRGAAPDTVQSFARYGNSLVIIWDSEDPASDLFIKAAMSVARALVIRENHESVETEHAISAIEVATRTIEKQLDHLDQIKTWAETVKNNGEKIADRAGRMRGDLAKEIESLDRHAQALKTNAPQA
ncbi:MAG: hypothetical protein LC130_06305 [Bryobacterales bacterium]|nr:hypothetical protein [Bryobacterales bacterium]MEB2361907.1 hypothetical protein [Bryobacterales bacterium]